MRPTGVPELEVDVEAEPGAAEAERTERGWQRPREKPACQAQRRNALRRSARETSQIRRAIFSTCISSQMQLRTTASKRTRGEDTQGREFYVTKKDEERFGPTARCPACADTTKGISGRHTHSDVCRDRVGKLLMDEGAQRVESYFEMARVRV